MKDYTYVKSPWRWACGIIVGADGPTAIFVLHPLTTFGIKLELLRLFWSWQFLVSTG